MWNQSLCCFKDIESPPLTWAAKKGGLELLRALLQAGADINRSSKVRNDWMCQQFVTFLSRLSCLIRKDARHCQKQQQW